MLKERDAQLEFNKLKEAAKEGMDRAYLEQARLDQEEAIMKEQIEAHKRLASAKKNKGFIKAQYVCVPIIATVMHTGTLHLVNYNKQLI